MNCYNDGVFRRISKTAAKRVFHTSKRAVFMCPSNFRPDNKWSPAVRLYLDQEFDNQVNCFEFYNCTCKETGRVASFYVLCEED